MAYYPPDNPQNGMIPPGFGQGMQGMFGGLKRGFRGGANALNPYSNRLLGFSAGMLGSGPSGAMKGLIAGSALDRESADRKKLNEAIAGLRNDPSGPLGELPESYWNFLEAADPSVTGKILADRMSPPSAGVNINMGDYKIPTNYRAVEPGNPDAGVERIPGVLTDTQVNDLSNAEVSVSSIESQLKRYEDLVGKYGIEVSPGIAKDQISTVRNSIQMEMKEMLKLGVLNGPDLDIMNQMIWDPSVNLSEKGGMGNLPGQIMTGVSGDAAARAKASADELRLFMKNKLDAYKQRMTGGETPPTLEELNEIYGVD